MLNKPEPELYYDYQKCKRYLESKYGFTYADFKEFWDSLDGQICGNGCLIPISRDSFDDEDEDESCAVYKKLIEEFGDDFQLYVWW